MSAPKMPVATGMPSAASAVGKGLVKALALVRRGGGGKAGAVAAQIGGQGELADHQRRPADIRTDRFILPASSLKMRSLAILAASLSACGFVIALHGADQDQQPRPAVARPPRRQPTPRRG